MTCIVGYAKGGVVTLGADSADSDGFTYRTESYGKLFTLIYTRAGEGVGTGLKMVLGFTTSWRMGQLLTTMRLPVFSSGRPVKYMIEEFIPTVRKVLKEGGFAEIENNRETGGTFLVGFEGHLFTVWDTYQINEAEYAAVGSGTYHAEAGMFVAKGYGEADTYKILRQGLLAAEHHVATVGAPFTFLDTDGKVGDGNANHTEHGRRY